MLVGCGMMTAGVPTMITAGVTGTLPGASDYKSTSGAWAQNHLSVGRVLLDDSGATAASGNTYAMQTISAMIMTLVTRVLTATADDITDDDHNGIDDHDCMHDQDDVSADRRCRKHHGKGNII